MKKQTPASYRAKYFIPLMTKLGMEHLRYDCENSKVDEYSRKKIMGPKSNDITDDVYTHAYIDELCKEAEKIDYQFVTKQALIRR